MSEESTAGIRSWLAGVVVFLASGAVLVLEILSLRLIAPYVGLTLEMNTAVIGVALAAIAVGAWLGGRAADVWPTERLVGPLLLGGGALVFAVTPLVRFVGGLISRADAGGVLLVAAAAIFVPSALLAAVTPVIVKARLESLRETGTVVGRLSGIGTLGSIVATFGTGFVLVAMVPTSTVLTGLGAVLTAVGLALTLAPGLLLPGAGQSGWRSRLVRRGTAGPLAFALLGLGATAAAPARCDVETAYHCARVATDPARPGGRVLELDTLQHSYVDLEDPRHLKFGYVRAIAATLDVFRPAGRPLRALHLGGGGLTLPRYLAEVRPGSVSQVFEIDAGVLALDRSRLGLRTGDDLRTRVVDARIGLADEPAGAWDVVVGDAFGGVAVPWHLTTDEAVTDIRRVLRPDGLYAANLIDHGPLDFVRAEVATLLGRFRYVAIVAEPAELTSRGGNQVVLASQAPLPVAALRARLGSSMRVLDTTAAFSRGAQVLTDDYAPVDQLMTPYPPAVPG